MLKVFSLLVIVFFISPILLSQNSGFYEDDTNVVFLQNFDEIKLPKNYKSEYRTALRRVRKVYPLALYAAHIVDSLENELQQLEKKRQQNKVTRTVHKELKADFKFLLKELYVQEGLVLTKLIHRETGMTVREIVEKYRGGAQASLYSGMAQLFDQELDAKYDPEGEDFILECVIRDIQTGKVKFENTFQTVDKEHYKADRKEYNARVKENKKQKRIQAREEKRKKE
jgi:hypothetical protein